MQAPTSSLRLVSLVLASGVTSTLCAQGSYTDLGIGSAYSVSDDGSVVVLTGNGTERWTAATGRVVIRPFEGLIGLTAVSADGNTVIADIKDTAGDPVAGIWTNGGTFQSIGYLQNALRCPSRSNAYDISADGSTVVGLSWDGCKGRAYKWDSTNGMVQLATLGSGSQRANAVSGDGAIVAGWSTASNGSRQAALWVGGGVMLLIPASTANPDQAGEAWAVNHDGSVVVGGENDGEAFRFTPAKGIAFLGELAGEEDTPFPFAFGTNSDGSRIVGGVGSAFGSPVAWIWTEEDGMRKFEDFLAENGITVPAGLPLAWGLDITPDGKFIVGQRGVFGKRAFLVRLPEGVKYGVGSAPANVLDLAATGSDQLGGVLVATTSGVTSASVTTLLSAGAIEFPVLGGMLLVDLSTPPILVTAPATGGAATLNIPIINDPTLVGAAFYLQSVALDSMQAQGLAFSNGLKVVVRN